MCLTSDNGCGQDQLLLVVLIIKCKLQLWPLYSTFSVMRLSVFRIMSGKINATWQSVAQYCDELGAVISFGGGRVLMYSLFFVGIVKNIN